MKRFLREAEAPGLQFQLNSCLAVRTNLPARWRSHFEVTYPALTELSQLVPHRTHGCLAKPGPDSIYVGKITDYCCLKPLTFGVMWLITQQQITVRWVYHTSYMPHTIDAYLSCYWCPAFFFSPSCFPVGCSPFFFFFFFFLVFIYFHLFIWLSWVIVAGHGIFHLHCSMWDLIPQPGIKLSPLHWECGVWCAKSESVKSWTLDHQGSPCSPRGPVPGRMHAQGLRVCSLRGLVSGNGGSHGGPGGW